MITVLHGLHQSVIYEAISAYRTRLRVCFCARDGPFEFYHFIGGVAQW